jgi:hypothetical protein
MLLLTFVIPTGKISRTAARQIVSEFQFDVGIAVVPNTENLAQQFVPSYLRINSSTARACGRGLTG